MFRIPSLKSTLAPFLFALIMFASMTSAAHARDQTLVGMWEVVGTPEASSDVPPFFNIAQISRDGFLSNVDPSEGVGLGSWRRVSHNQYSVTFYGFIPMGPDTGRYTVNGLLNLGPHQDTFSGKFVTEITDIDGNYLFDFAGTISATRL